MKYHEHDISIRIKTTTNLTNTNPITQYNISKSNFLYQIKISDINNADSDH